MRNSKRGPVAFATPAVREDVFLVLVDQQARDDFSLVMANNPGAHGPFLAREVAESAEARERMHQLANTYRARVL